MPIYSSRVLCNTVWAVLACAGAGFVLPATTQAQGERSIAGVRGGVVAGGELDNYLRYLQTTGKVPIGAWGLRPFSATEVDALSTIEGGHPWKGSWLFRTDSTHHFSVLPVSTTAGFNTAFPWGGNDGAVWAGRGLTTSLQGGFAAAWGPVSLVINPIVFRAENTGFALQPNGEPGNGIYRNGDYPNNVDLPQRFGNRAYSRFDPGQSTLRIDGFGVTAGISTANQYWGPATEYPVVLGNNAAGVPHFFLGTARPANIGIGRLQARAVYGLESQSSFSPVSGSETFGDADHSGTKRFMSGLVVTFSPAPIPGLELGATRYFHEAWRGSVTTEELRTPFEGILKSSLPAETTVDGSSNKDALKNQVASLFGRWVLPHSGFEVYAEYGHEDHNADLRDFEEEPDHTRIAMAGFRKVFVRTDSVFDAFRAEYIDASSPSLLRHRGEGGNYTHTVLRQGHTQAGQLLGADIGVGSAGGAIAAWDRYSPHGRTTLYLQRVVQNNGSSLLESEATDTHAQHLYAVVGFTRLRFGTLADIVYGASLTEGKRGMTLDRQTNLGATLGLVAHFRQ